MRACQSPRLERLERAELPESSRQWREPCRRRRETLRHRTPSNCRKRGELDEWWESIATKRKRREALREQVQAWYATAKADDGFKETGTKYVLFAGLRATQRRITSMAKLRKALGAIARFDQVVNVVLGKLDELLSPEQQAAAGIVEARTGARVVKTMRLAEPDAQAKEAA